MVQQDQLGIVEKYGAAGELCCLGSSVNDSGMSIRVILVPKAVALLATHGPIPFSHPISCESQIGR